MRTGPGLLKYLIPLLAAGLATVAGLAPAAPRSGVPHGSAGNAQTYYHKLATEIAFRDSATILESTLDDVPNYMGYSGLSGQDLQRLSSAVLMDPAALGRPCEGISPAQCLTAVVNPDLFRQTFGANPIQDGEILVSRFFAPKIINVNDLPDTRALGWRKLVRLRARPGSQARQHGIDVAIILFNFFVPPSVQPFGPTSESVNTQVILTSTADDRDSIYWLDYGRLSEGGRLSLNLDATFDARDFEPNTAPGGGASGVQPYFVPDGCVGCHGGENEHRTLVNYLDTDHWYDRLDNDFARLRLEGAPVLFDAGTEDTTDPDYAKAFEVIRHFNKEAEQHAALKNPQSFHRTAAKKWLDLHEHSNDHFPPIARAVPSTASWDPASPNDAQELNLLNRYCFRCHGTVKFNVFDKASVQERRAQIRSRLQPLPEQLKADPGFIMPLDRQIPERDLKRILESLP